MWFYQPDNCVKHEMGAEHAESPERIQAITTALDKAGLYRYFNQVSAPEVEQELLQLAHDDAYIDQIYNSVPEQDYCRLDPDTCMNPFSLQATLEASGAAVDAVNKVLTHDTIKQAFCCTRPPGHHAEHHRAMGFCLFNAIAIAALYARKKMSLESVLVVDFDVHHGNGTEDILANQPGCHLISTFQSPLYPGTGIPPLADNIHNFPLAPESGSHAMRTLWQQQVLPLIDELAPQLILVSAGFDAHRQDPLAQLNLEDDDYFWFGQQLREKAAKHTSGRLVACLEGGYHLEALGRSVTAYIQGLLGLSQ